MVRGQGEQTARDELPAGSAASGDVLMVAGEGRLTSYPLRGELVIGRDPRCDVVVDHPSLSRRHAVLRAGPPMTIQDLDSTNGTRLASGVVRGGPPTTLLAGDMFHIGPCSFAVVARRGPDDAPPSWRHQLDVVDPTADGVPRIVHDLAQSAASIVILGETGVGKEVLAETIHQLSARPGELVRINCAALSEALLESELFGHERGAFTGAVAAKAGLLEAAARGTVFLDEVGDLPAGIQAKLLRAVERREVLRLGATRPIPVDVRFVAATNRDLPADVEAGRFRRDLFFRLDGVTLAIPPLRDRRAAIAPLARRFVADAGPAGGQPGRLTSAALAALEGHPWPGNVRELKAVVERAVMLARGSDIDVRHLVFARLPAPPATPAPAAAPPGSLRPPTASDDASPAGVDDLTAEQRAERQDLVRALEECAGNQTRAARLLGISRSTMVNKVRLYRIARPQS